MATFGFSVLVSYAVNNTSIGVRVTENVNSCESDPNYIDCGFSPDDSGYTKYAQGIPFVHTASKNSSIGTIGNTNYGLMILNYILITVSLEAIVILGVVVRNRL